MSERTTERSRARAKRVGQIKRKSMRCERTDKRVAQYLSLYFLLFWPTVKCQNHTFNRFTVNDTYKSKCQLIGDYHDLITLLLLNETRLYYSGVLKYKTVSDRLVTREKPRRIGFMGRTAFAGSKFIYLSFFRAKNYFH